METRRSVRRWMGVLLAAACLWGWGGAAWAVGEPQAAQAASVEKGGGGGRTPAAEMKKKVRETQRQTEAEELDKVVQEAMSAYRETLHAVDLLEKGDKEGALKTLETAVGKLDVLIGRFPEVAYLPIDVRVETLDIVGDRDEIRRKRDEVEFLVKKGYLQAARRMMDLLVSEIRITTTNLPMETYPTAIRGVARLIEEGKVEQAKRALATTLGTVVRIERSIPIPVLNSQSLIAEAARIVKEAEGGSLPPERKKEVIDLLQRAHEELEIAEDLGYGRRDLEFADIHRDIREIEAKIRGGEKTGTLFQTLKKRLEAFRRRISK